MDIRKLGKILVRNGIKSLLVGELNDALSIIEHSQCNLQFVIINSNVRHPISAKIKSSNFAVTEQKIHLKKIIIKIMYNLAFNSSRNAKDFH